MGRASGPRFRSLRAVSLLLLICAPLIETGCYTRVPSSPSLSLPSTLQIQELIRSYGLSRNTTCAPYLEERLSSIIPSPPPRFSIVLLASDTPLALSPGGNTIVLSAGLLRRLTTEGDVIFLLAHEVAHYQLGHVDTMRGSDLPDSKKRAGFEFAADAYAQQALVRGGYDPQSGVRALLAVYSYGGIPKNDPAYPSLNERLVRLVQSEWSTAQRGERGSRSFRGACGEL